jgi:hypothetical protein
MRRICNPGTALDPRAPDFRPGLRVVPRLRFFFALATCSATTFFWRGLRVRPPLENSASISRSLAAKGAALVLEDFVSTTSKFYVRFAARYRKGRERPAFAGPASRLTKSYWQELIGWESFDVSKERHKQQDDF